VASDECWHHDKEQEDHQRQNQQQVQIQADEGVYKKKRKGMSWVVPAQQAFDPVLEQKDHSNSIAVSVRRSIN